LAKLKLIATATFGLEAVVKREIISLGYKIIKSEDARITFLGDERAVCRSNLWLRCADRVLIQLGEFKALTFEELFQQTKALPWEEWIPMDGEIIVTGSSVKSQLHSVPDCQKIVKKAIVEKLKEIYSLEWFPETGANYTVKVRLLKDEVSITLDTSGVGLHKRGYRVSDVEAPIKETLASALVQLSFWKPGRLLVDPLCGSGTIPIEAAMLGRNIAPGLSRNFVAEEWDVIPKELWKEERKKAFEAIDYDADVRIIGSDISKASIKSSKLNAIEAGVDDCIDFHVSPASNLRAPEEYGIIITNPPYGERIGKKDQIHKIYDAIRNFYIENPTWSIYLVTSDKEFEKNFLEKPADRRRKLYNGRIEICYYQYHGEKPKGV
jgi:putative N6-adenine-specific DNA methylase